jgi:8-amino-7-oxononanoate synthase
MYNLKAFLPGSQLMIHLDELIRHLFFQLKNLSPRTTPLLQIPVEIPQSPIFSLLTPEPRSLARFCQEAGFVVRPIVPPTATSRVRVCLHAGNSFEDVERLVMRIRGWLELAENKELQNQPKIEFMKSSL